MQIIEKNTELRASLDRIMAKGLETGIGLGDYQQEISDRESTTMPYIEHFGLWPD
jgi:hypothetical protein